MKAGIQVEFRLYGTTKREGSWYIAHCPPLDITTQGRTLEEAKRNLAEAAELFVESCLERGTLDQALKELGFSPARGEQHHLPANAFQFDVPVPLRFQKPCPA